MRKHRKKIVSVIAMLLAALMVFSLLMSLLPVSAYADKQSELEAIRQQKNEVAGQRIACQEKIDKLKEQQALVLEQKAALDERNEFTAQQIVLVDEEIALYDEMIEEKSKEVDAARQLEEEQLQRYRSRVRSMEENGGYDILGIILKARNLSDMLTAIDDMGEIMEQDRRLEDQYIAAREAREQEQDEYEDLKTECEEKKAALEEEKAELEAQLLEATELLAELEKDIEKAVKEYEAALRAEEAFAAQMSAIAAQIAREAAERAQQAALQAQQQQQQQQQAGQNQGNTGDAGSAPAPDNSGAQQAPNNSGNNGNGGNNGNSGNNGNGGNNGNSGSAPAPSNPAVGTGSWMWPFPASNLVTSRYGWRIHPILGNERFHSGIDVNGFGLAGSPIVAADGGTVCKAEYSDSYGNYVMIDHGNGNLSLYAHFSGIAVYNGQQVSQGQTIGYCGSTGWATGDHLHLEIYINGSRVDPESIFGGLPHYNC